MHRSRLSTFVIDCKSDNIDDDAEFWSKALGRPVVKADSLDPDYRELAAQESEPLLLVQRVDQAPPQ